MLPEQNELPTPLKQEVQTTEADQSYKIQKTYLYTLQEEQDIEGKTYSATLYFIGSIHTGAESMYPFPSEVEAAFDSADILVTESGPFDAEASIRVAERNLLPATSSADDYIDDFLTQDGSLLYYYSLINIFSNIGLSAKFYHIALKTEPIYSNLLLNNLKSSLKLNDYGISGEHGVETYFETKSIVQNKEFKYLETPEATFNSYFSLSMETQIGILLNSIYNFYIPNDPREVLQKYNVQDKDYFLQDIEYYKSQMLDYYDALIKNRNIAWIESIKTFVDDALQNNTTYFIIAGFSHFIGEDSIIVLLQDEGYEITETLVLAE